MLANGTFVLGGAASGKSLWAENLLQDSGLALHYVATGRTLDPEMHARVAVHRARRDLRWQTHEVDRDLAPVLADLGPGDAVLIDCATMWLTNVMMDGDAVDPACTALLDALGRCAAPWVVVSNEVGHGIVPDNALARRFRDAQGRVNIAFAAQADCAVQITAGLPLILKGTLP